MLVSCSKCDFLSLNLTRLQFCFCCSHRILLKWSKRRKLQPRAKDKQLSSANEIAIDNDNLAPVVQTLDSAIHWITQLVLLVFIRWIVIYPVDSAIHRLNNWGLMFYWTTIYREFLPAPNLRLRFFSSSFVLMDFCNLSVL